MLSPSKNPHSCTANDLQSYFADKHAQYLEGEFAAALKFVEMHADAIRATALSDPLAADVLGKYLYIDRGMGAFRGAFKAQFIAAIATWRERYGDGR